MVNSATTMLASPRQRGRARRRAKFPPYLTTTEVAYVLRTGVRQVKRDMEAGIIPHYAVAGTKHRRVERDKFRAWLSGHDTFDHFGGRLRYLERWQRARAAGPGVTTTLAPEGQGGRA